MARSVSSISLDNAAAARGRWIPWLFVAGMLAVIAVNAVLIFFAFSSWSGTVSSRPYERGLDYNRVLAAAARESALGWTADAQYRAGGEGGTLMLVLLDAEARPLAGQVSVTARRPLEPAPPVSIAMRHMGEGRYAGTLSGLSRSGLWELRIAVVRGGDTAHFSRRMVVP